MDAEKVNIALANRRLPITSGTVVIQITFFAAMIFIVCLVGYINGSFKVGLSLLPAVILVFAYLVYGSYRDNQLYIFKSEVAFDKKEIVIQKLASGNELESVVLEHGYCSFDIKAEIPADEFSIVILYGESAYGVNSLKGAGRSIRKSNEKSREIISKISNIEAQL
jgi:hypothetical protein